MLYSIVVLHEAVSLYIYFLIKGRGLSGRAAALYEKKGGGPYKLNNGQLGHVSMTTTPEFQLSKIKRRCHPVAQHKRHESQLLSFIYIYLSSLFSSR